MRRRWWRLIVGVQRGMMLLEYLLNLWLAEERQVRSIARRMEMLARFLLVSGLVLYIWLLQ